MHIAFVLAAFGIFVLVVLVIAFIKISSGFSGKHHGGWTDLIPAEVAILEERQMALRMGGVPPKARPAGRPLFGGFPHKGIKVYGNGITAPFTRMVVEDFHWQGWEIPAVRIEEEWRFVPFDLITGIYPIMIMLLRHTNEEGTPWDFELKRLDHLALQIETADMHVAVVRLKPRRRDANEDQRALAKALDKGLGKHRLHLLKMDQQLFGIEYVRSTYKFYPTVDRHGWDDGEVPVVTASASHFLLDLYKHKAIRDMPDYRKIRVAMYRRWGIRRLESVADDESWKW